MKIAFGYKMGSGKDEACLYLSSIFPCTTLSFSAPIYELLYKTQGTLGFPMVKDRDFLRFVGQWAKKYDDDIWIKKFFESIDSCEADGGKFILCSDLRFLKEFWKLKDNGWFCVKIVRDEGRAPDTHISEQELDVLADSDWDYVIKNNGTLWDFYGSLDIMLTALREKEEKTKGATIGPMKTVCPSVTLLT